MRCCEVLTRRIDRVVRDDGCVVRGGESPAVGGGVAPAWVQGAVAGVPRVVVCPGHELVVEVAQEARVLVPLGDEVSPALL